MMPVFYINTKNKGVVSLTIVDGMDADPEINKFKASNPDQYLSHSSTEPPGYAIQILQAQLDAQANSAADKAIADMIPDAVIALVSWAEGQATGKSKTTMKTILDKFNAENDKKK